MKGLVLTVICSIGMNLSAVAESITDGSVAVAAWSQKEVVIAADSRGTIGNSYHDTECKVRAIGDKLIFAETGRSRLGMDHGWDFYTLAENQFDSLVRNGASDRLAEKLAIVWGEGVKKEFERIGIESVDGIDTGYIATGMFADFENNGELLIYISEVTFKIIPPANLVVIANPPHLDDHSQGKYYSGEVGVADIIHELEADKTPQGKKWADEYWDLVGKSRDKIVAHAIGTVKVVIDGLPKTGIGPNGVPFSKVGTPIAAARLIRGKGIDWPSKGMCCVSEKKTHPQPKKKQSKN